SQRERIEPVTKQFVDPQIAPFFLGPTSAQSRQPRDGRPARGELADRAERAPGRDRSVPARSTHLSTLSGTPTGGTYATDPTRETLTSGPAFQARMRSRSGRGVPDTTSLARSNGAARILLPRANTRYPSAN